MSGSDDEREQEHEDGKPAHSEASRAAQQRESTGGGDVMRGIQGRGAVLGVEQEKGGTRRESGTDSAEQQPSRVGVRGLVKDRGEERGRDERGKGREKRPMAKDPTERLMRKALKLNSSALQVVHVRSAAEAPVGGGPAVGGVAGAPKIRAESKDARHREEAQGDRCPAPRGLGHVSTSYQDGSNSRRRNASGASDLSCVEVFPSALSHRIRAEDCADEVRQGQGQVGTFGGCCGDSWMELPGNWSDERVGRRRDHERVADGQGDRKRLRGVDVHVVAGDGVEGGAEQGERVMDAGVLRDRGRADALSRGRDVSLTMSAITFSQARGRSCSGAKRKSEEAEQGQSEGWLEEAQERRTGEAETEAQTKTGVADREPEGGAEGSGVLSPNRGPPNVAAPAPAPHDLSLLAASPVRPSLSLHDMSSVEIVPSSVPEVWIRLCTVSLWAGDTQPCDHRCRILALTSA